MKDKFGGEVIDEPTDKFGGVLVSDSPPPLAKPEESPLRKALREAAGAFVSSSIEPQVKAQEALPGAIESGSAQALRTVRDVLSPTTYLPESEQSKLRPFTISPEGIRQQTKEEAERIQPGRSVLDLAEPAPNAPTNPLRRLAEGATTPGALLTLPFAETRLGASYFGLQGAQGLAESARILLDPNADPDAKREALESVPLNAAMVKHGTTKGLLNAERIRSDSGQPDQARLRTSQGEADRGGDVEQAPPQPTKPVAQREEAQKAKDVAFDPVQTGPLDAAAYKDPKTSIVTYGANHPEILQKLGIEGYDTPESRNTPDFGYRTKGNPFVPRASAGPIAEHWKQDLSNFDPQQPHSNQVAAKPGGTTPLGETQPTPAPTGEGQPQTVTKPGQLGGGAAGVEEVLPLSSGTGLKNAVGEMERVGLGLHDAPETVTRNMAKAWGESGQIESDKPGTGANLAAMLGRDPDMGLTDTESALLLRHKVDLWNRMNNAAERSHTGDAASREKAQKEHDALAVDFGNLLDAVKLRGREWGREGRWRQAMAKEDFTFSSVDDMNRYHRTLTGEDLPGEVNERAEKKAKLVKSGQDKADKAQAAVLDDLKNKVNRRADMVKAERDALDAASLAVRENAARIARADVAARIAKTEQEMAVAKIEQDRARKALEESQKATRDAMVRLAKEEAKVKERTKLVDQEKAARKALDAASKAVRDAAAARAKAETESRVAKAKSERDAARIQAKSAQKAVDAADKLHLAAARDLAKAARKLRDDPIRAVWDKVKEQIEKGEGDFNRIRGRVAVELGMKADQVGKIMAQDAKTKRLSDDAWRKQQRAAQLREEAKRWVAAAGDPETLKLIKSVPSAMFGAKVFGHGTVPLGTHAPAVAFMPNHWLTYGQRYGTMYHMVASKAFYEAQVNDLQNRANFVPARRGGLVNDPRAYEDYTNPEIAKYIPGGKMGTRGFLVLKILRQDMFDTWWDKLPKSLQTDLMAKLISDTVNHETGVIKAKAPFALGLGLFAPRLLGSRLAFALGDPAKAAWILTKHAWTRVTPEDRQFAMHQLTSKAMILGTYYGLLAANQGILSATGSDQKVNGIPEALGGGGFDPMKSDFMKFKIAGMDFAYGNALLSLGRLPASLYRVVSSDGGKTKNLIYDDERVDTILLRYGRSQLSPFAGTAVDLAFGSDFASRPLPSKMFGLIDQNRPVPKRLAAQGLEQYSWPEYWSEQVSPIPFQEALKEAWKYGLGMNDDQVRAMERAAAATAVNWGTGGRLTEDVQPEPAWMRKK